MKRLAFVCTLLGSASIISAVDHAPDQDTWCITYMSTYLAPVSNQANSPALTRPAEEPGRQPIAPSLKPTFAANISTQRTQGSFDTDVPTSIVLQESSGAVGLSSDGPEFSTLGTEQTVAQSGSGTQSLDPITEPAIVEAVTSSFSIDLDAITSTDAIPTSSSLVESAGRSVIFQISVVDNEKRNINRRQAIGGFVGNENPQICTFAATFNLADGRLFEGGAPIYYSGESYKELSGLDIPTSGSITKTFEDSGRLVFRNSGLPNGRAGFCQTPDGIVYVTFTNGPVGCISVDLVVYDVAQCQDGRLVGDDDVTSTASETVPQDTTTPGGTGPKVTSSIEGSTTVEVSYSSDHSVIQSELIGTSLTSDLGISNIVSSDTAHISVSSKSATKSTLHSEASATDDAQPSTESDPISFSSTTDGPDDTASVSSTDTDTVIKETTSMTTGVTSVDITTVDTTNTETTDTTTISSSVPNPSCTNTNNPYTASNGVSFDISCNTLVNAIILEQLESSNFISCVQACSENVACVAAELHKPSFTCLLLSYVYEDSAEKNDNYDVAMKVPVIADTTTATTDATITSSDTPNPQCTDTNNPYTASNGVTFTISCNTVVGAVVLQIIDKSNFISCVEACSVVEACVASELYKPALLCYLFSEVYDEPASDNDDSDAAIKNPIIADTTTSATDTITADVSATSTVAPDPDCTDLDSPYTASNGVTFALSCYTTLRSVIPLGLFFSRSFVSCMDTCSEIEECVGVQFFPTDHDCQTITDIGDGSTLGVDYCHIALKDAVVADTTTTDALVADTTTSAAPTETSSASTCEDLDNPLTDGGESFEIFCGIQIDFISIDQFTIASFLGCIQFCGQNGNCKGVTYERESRQCNMWSSVTSDFAYDTPYDTAFKEDT